MAGKYEYITYTGVLLDFSNIKESDINLIDIAHHLTNECRYGGSMAFYLHYSVAEHSVLLAEYASKGLDNEELAKACLFHDASEYLLKDIPSGLKKLLPDYQALEDDLTTLIFKKYGIDYDLLPFVKELDSRIVLNEALALYPHHYSVFKKEGLFPLAIDNLAVNDDDYGQYTPGTVPKTIVEKQFLWWCDYLGIEDV